MAATLTLTTALAACASPAPQATGPVMAAPLRVTNNVAPFSMDQGARAKRVAMDTCAAAGRGLELPLAWGPALWMALVLP